MGNSDTVKIRRAILSVSDKTGIIGFAKFLASMGVDIISTGGTAKVLAENKIPYTPIETVTGNPEAFGGRMKTISFAVASGILFRRDNSEDIEQAKKLGIKPIDLVVCNLYPFAETVKKQGSEEELIENIDIGGPTMIRAAAKNFSSVAICVDPSQYAECISEMENNNGISLGVRKKWMALAFEKTANYDSMIAEQFTNRYTDEKMEWLQLRNGKELRYGENPHQQAIYYRTNHWQGEASSVTAGNIIQGKPLSYNNLRDADAAHRSASDAWIANKQVGVAVSIIKHMNPCGLAVADNAIDALELAWAGDPVSSFGSVIAFTGEVSVAVADWLQDKFVEVILAPYIVPDALKIFAKKKNLRILLCKPRLPVTKEKMVVSISGGLLVQEEDEGLDPEFQSVTKNPFLPEWNRLAHFGVMAAKHLKSNAIALVKENAKGYLYLIGAGMGQPNRVDCIRRLAGPRASEKESLENAMLISDAFFPFADNIEFANALEISRIVQPGGSVRDEEVIAMANKFEIAMAFTGRRHFRH